MPYLILHLIISVPISESLPTPAPYPFTLPINPLPQQPTSLVPHPPPNAPTPPTREISPAPPLPHPMTTRSRTGSLRPKSFPGFHTYFSTRHPLQAFHTILTEKEPRCFSKAIADSR
jgi:hypothetical protein